jgi:hypothetical protein
MNKTIIVTIGCIIGYNIILHLFGILGVFCLFWVASMQLGCILSKEFEDMDPIDDVATCIAALLCGPVVLLCAIFEYWPYIKQKYIH